MTIPSGRPTAYTGIKETNPPQLYFRQRDPDLITFKDYRNYSLGDMWQNTLSLQWFILVSVAQQQGIWEPFTGATAGSVSTLTGDDGIPVNPLIGNINVQGGGAGAIAFTSGGIGQLNAQVQVDGVTIQIAGNQLIAVAATTFAWIEIAVPTLMAVDTGYVVNAGVPLLVTLPGNFAFGDVIEIQDKGGNGFTVQAAGFDVVVFNGVSSTAGGGWITNNPGCHLKILGVTTNSVWNVIESLGNFTPF